VPVPRRFDRQPPERDTTRINERIRVPEIRLIDETGQQVGIMRTQEALRLAQEKDLDLVEVAPDAKPPVCRILDYSKYRYEQLQKQKAARKHQQQITIREIKFRPKIAQGDYETKKGHVIRFLKRRDKVKITIMFRGREVTHPERGTQILDRLAEELAELATIEQRPNLDGRNMTMLLGPSKAVLAGQFDKDGGEAHDAAESAPEQPSGRASGRSSGRRSREDSGDEPGSPDRDEAASPPAAAEPAQPADPAAADAPPAPAIDAQPAPAEEPVAAAPDVAAAEERTPEPATVEPAGARPRAKSG